MSKSSNFLDKPIAAGALALLILASVVAFSLETLPSLSSRVRESLALFEVFVVVVFTAEYMYRLYAAPKRLRFVFGFYGIVDLLAILPFYLGLVVDLRSIRLLRVLRMVRLLKLARYNAALLRLATALRASKDELLVSMVILAIALYLAAFGIYHFEHDAQPDKFSSIFDALWWAVATVSTVGYGDVYPVTVGGRVFTFFVLVISLGIIAIPTSIFATALLAVRKNQAGNSGPSET
ncbi:MAG: ion transporter [Xanthomonadales bacterium]|nr:ion transporter [Xanthomonadales bacterium]